MTHRIITALDTFRRRPGIVMAAFVACLLLVCAGLRGIRFDASLATFFPPGSEAARTLAFLSDASLADKVAVSFGFGMMIPEDDLHGAVADFVARAKTLPGVCGVLDSADGIGWQAGLTRFYEVMPQWFDAAALDALAPRLEAEGVRTALKRRFAQLARPEGMFLAEAVRCDPLGLFDRHLEALGTAAGRLGYDVVPDAGRLMSRDGSHRLVLLDTDASATDVRASAALLDTLNVALAELPPWVRADVVCAHAHAVANQAAVRHDLAVAGSLSALLLAVMLLFVYRDMRMAVIALAPLSAVLVALCVNWRVFGNVTFLAGAFGSILAGLSVDYGIHVYRAGGRVRPLLLPLGAGLGTTFAVFFGFFVSRAEGWRQVGCFGAAAIAAAFVFSVCVLPLWARKTHRVQERVASLRPVPAGLRVGLAMLLAVWVCVGLARLRADNDFARLNGAGKAVFDTEKRFQDIWGEKGGARAILAAKVADGADADEVGAQLFAEVSAVLGGDAVSGFAAVAPTPRQRAENLAAWQAFWSAGNRAERLRETLREEGAAFGFADDAFAPFWERVGAPCDDTSTGRLGVLLNLLRERFVLSAKSGGAYAAVYVADDAAVLAGLAPWLAGRADVALVSRAGLPGALARAFSTDAVRVAVVMAVLLVSMAWLVLRSLRSAVMALLPCVAAVGVVFGTLGVVGIPMNVVHLLAAMLTLGVAFDYGLFLMCVSQGKLGVQVRSDVRLCLLTTLAGSAPLLLARHPVIFSLGLALTLGVCAGYVVAAWLVFPFRREGSA